MKKLLSLFIILFSFAEAFAGPVIKQPGESMPEHYIWQQVQFNPNNISTWIWNTGIFDQDMRTINTPGLMWPAGTERFAVFTQGVTIGALVNSAIRLSSCSYRGELLPGRIVNGVPDSSAFFKLYKVNRGDGPANPDWENWYRMVPYGAPYIDVNNNGVFEPYIDTPGVKNAEQTVFACFTDGFQIMHNQSEGFSGGTLPLYAEIHLTAWGYSKQAYADMIFMKYEIINKGSNVWNSTYMAIICDDELGDASDDFVGSDTVRQMGYVYNGDNFDGWNGNPPNYGANPPAVGHIILKGPRIKGTNPVNLKMTSFTIFEGTGWGGINCVTDPSSPSDAYYYLRGIKKDGSYFFHPYTHQRVKILWPGDPETGQGWTELGYNGNPNMVWVPNCAGGDTMTSCYLNMGDRRVIIGSGSDALNISPGDTQKIFTCELIARGTSNLNSVTRLKQLADVAWSLYNNNFVIGVENISTEVPSSFSLYQNYPNPFNPVTKIRFDIAENGKWKNENGVVTLKVYDVLGKEVATLVNERMQPGMYEVTWDASGFGSGVYFYRLSYAGSNVLTKKMLLIK